MVDGGRGTRSWKTPEFILVVVMLVVLVLLVVAVLAWPVAIPSGDTTATLTNILDYRKGILSIIITAFGAWVGAGAAYFFGRENLREAASSLLAMRQESPADRLRRTTVREIPPRLIEWLVSVADTMSAVTEQLREKPSYWFIPIVDDKGLLETVIEEEAVWRLRDLEMSKPESLGKTVQELNEAFNSISVGVALEQMRETSGLQRFKDTHVVATLDKSAADVYAAMQNQGVNLAVILDDDGKPTHFFTTGDVRELLMRVG